MNKWIMKIYVFKKFIISKKKKWCIAKHILAASCVWNLDDKNLKEKRKQQHNSMKLSILFLEKTINTSNTKIIIL